ncbi:MAG: hypothetical protein AAF192_08435, partial [Pseudomonadota bacterium]
MTLRASSRRRDAAARLPSEGSIPDRIPGPGLGGLLRAADEPKTIRLKDRAPQGLAARRVADLPERACKEAAKPHLRPHLRPLTDGRAYPRASLPRKTIRALRAASPPPAPPPRDAATRDPRPPVGRAG